MAIVEFLWLATAGYYISLILSEIAAYGWVKYKTRGRV